MLPPLFDLRFKQMMTTKIEQISIELERQFSKDSAEAAHRGHANSSYTHGLFQKRRIAWITSRAAAVIEIHRRLVPILSIQYTDSLADGLKAYVDTWISESWTQKLLESDPPASSLKERFMESLMSERQKAIRDARLEIDLMVDALRADTSKTTGLVNRELDQKFRILWSIGEAQRDFDRYTAELDGVNGGIAVLFLDIDKFKDLNTRYTEPVIDRCLLPNTMRLMEALVRSRGPAYKHGGDEYVAILPNHEPDEAFLFAEKIRKAFEQTKFTVERDTVSLTVSIGVALWPYHGNDYHTVETRASAAKQVAKLRRNSTQLATTDHVATDPLVKLGLASSSQRLARFLNERSQHAGPRDPILEPKDIRQELGMSDDDLAIAADELRSRSWANLDRTGGKVGFSHISPTPALFFETDPLLKGWDPRKDARTLAARALTMEVDSINLSDLARELRWEARRMNPATYWLENRQLATLTTARGNVPFRFGSLLVTPATRRFAAEE